MDSNVNSKGGRMGNVKINHIRKDLDNLERVLNHANNIRSSLTVKINHLANDLAEKKLAEGAKKPTEEET